MLIKVISYLPAIIGLITIGLFTLLNNPKSIRNRVFAATNLLLALWLASLFIADMLKNADVALWFLRFGLLFGALMILSFYCFALVFPYQSKINTRRQFVYLLPLLIIGLLSLTSFMVPYVSIHDFGVQPEGVGFLYAFSDIVSVTYLFGAALILLKKYKKSDRTQKNQIKFVLFGLLVALVANVLTGIFLTLLKIETDFILLGSFSLFIFSLFVAYAIARHGLFDIRLIVARSIAYLLLISTLIGLYTIVVFGVTTSIFAEDSVFVRQIVPIAAALFLAGTAPYFRRIFDRITNRVFYRDAYEPQAFLDQLNQELVNNIELAVLLRQTAQVMENNLKCSSCRVVVMETDNSDIRIFGTAESRLDKQEIVELRDELTKEHKKIVVSDDLENHRRELQKTMTKYDISVAVSLMAGSGVHKKPLAYLLLGPKKSGNIYNKQDLKIVEIIADELIIAIQNALRFEEIQGFAATLQEKVNQATDKLQKTNRKLRELDETKDEFISMASHQLRTPLTSVKGYMSMVIDGDAGELKKQQKQLLDQAFVSSQRMVYLIADLLNVSRLKTGKFIIDAHPTDLAEVVEGEISQLRETAKRKNLKLIYDKPAKFPKLMLDETKIRQVIMNFADNAIYYTPSGGEVTIELKEDKNSIYFTVKDNGIGVPKKEKEHMFTKFYRAKNARKARPDGTGLGLFMAKKVVDAQGGHILFESEEGKGSTFGFCFNKHSLAVKKT